MSLSIQVDQAAAEEVARLIGDVSKRASNLREINIEALQVVQADVDQRFSGAPGVRSTGSVLGGATWPRLTDSYLKSRPIREGGQRLRDTGELLQSLQVGRGSNTTENNPNGWVFGTSLPKARGLHRKRPILFFYPGLTDNLALLYAAFLTGEAQ